MASRYDQLAKLSAEARAKMDDLSAILQDMDQLRSEVQEWYDAMNENWQQGEAGQKACEVGELDLDATSLLSEVEAALDALDGTL